MKKLLCALVLIFSNYSYSQSTQKIIDSLKTLLNSQKELPLVNTLTELAWEYENRNIDSALFYSKQSLNISKKIKSDEAFAASYNSLASCFDALGKLDSAIYYHQKSLDLKLKLNNKIGAANSYNNLGIVYDLSGDFDVSLQNYFKALNIFESENVPFDKVPMVLGNIGIVYKKQKEFGKALEYYNRALEIYQANNYNFGEVVTKGNIGAILIHLKQFEKAIKYCSEAQEAYAKLGYNRYVPYMLSNIAIAKDSLKRYNEAEKDFERVISLFQKEQNYYELVHNKLSFAHNLHKQQKLTQAFLNANDALQIAKNKGFKEWEVKAYKVLAHIEKSKQNYKAYATYFEMYAQKKDSLFEENKTKTVFELETKYKTAKKEKEILAQRAQIAEKELNINRKNMQLLGLGVLAIVLSVFGYLVYKQQKLKNKQLQKENQLKEALSKIETQNKLQDQRLRISRDLHDNIGAQLTFIISSIENLQYGFKISNTNLANKLTSISSFTKDTINELRDTIWAMNKNEISLTDLQIRISNFIDKAHVSSQGIHFNFLVAEKLKNNTVFTSVQGMNIYRIIQEAINNAIKYANASSVNVEISEKNNKLLFEVFDNGTGFNLEEVEAGNGLNNMKKRATDVGASITIQSNKNSGTKIAVTL